MKHGEFTAWVQRNFGIRKSQSATYMRLAEASQKSGAQDFSSLGDFIRKTGTDPNYNTFASKKPDWQQPVRDIIGRVDTETLNLKREDKYS